MSLIHNEQTKYIANTFDRASTSCITVGVFAPIAAALYAPTNMAANLLPFVISAVCWLFTAGVLHLSGKRVLRRLS
ncbi:hypothetical protein C7477_10388 [Phyllobacterium leguminum]|uniref:Uncharacterized protein n=1 Tax=Phyllobacterium leguminum TaxID=314237 RepID=A0A318TJV8_9HYPH|nr:hypothetical protein C7477_10388 [Phyllobacterium leguminum]